jgi:hypothetical protein
MVKRALTLVAIVAVAGAGAIRLAGPADAAQVTIGSNPALGWACHADLTVIPYRLDWLGPEPAWGEFANITGTETCQTLGGPKTLTLRGDWGRVGSARNAITGACPPASVTLTAKQGDSYVIVGGWKEVTDETTATQSPQIIVLNEVFEDEVLGVPPVGLAYGISHTDPAACAAWPTRPNPPPSSFPTPAPFKVSADWDLSLPSLLSLCLTVHGVLPRTCAELL